MTRESAKRIALKCIAEWEQKCIAEWELKCIAEWEQKWMESGSFIHDLMSVQPMNDYVGDIFYLDYVYREPIPVNVVEVNFNVNVSGATA